MNTEESADPTIEGAENAVQHPEHLTEHLNGEAALGHLEVPAGQAADNTILETAVSGIPTLFVRRPGAELSAGLVFRVGQADETLAVRGITHLVEHLALHSVGAGDVHHNGTTEDVVTNFYASGSVEQVVRLLNGVCTSLRDLPTHRIEVEKEILRTEARGRGSAVRMGPMIRYGAEGHGLASYAELGLPGIDAGAVSTWAREAFTLGNVVLWVVGEEIPDSLDLQLPDGPRLPLPAVTSAVPQTPAWFLEDNADVVHVSAVVPRSPAARLFTQVVNRAVFEELRQRDGLSYTAAAQYWPRDRDSAVISVMADSLPEKRGAVVGAMVDVLARVRWGTITDDELAAARAMMTQALGHRDWLAASLPTTARDLLLGLPVTSMDQLAQESADVTVADLHSVAEALHDSAVAQVPVLGLDWAGFTQAPMSSTEVVSGREFRVPGHEHTALVVGPEGVMMRWEGGQSTVLYRDAVILQSFGDGGRWLVGRDGFQVQVEPTVHGVDPSTIAGIDAAVHRSRVVSLPARPAGELPQPPPPPSDPGPTGTRAPAPTRRRLTVGRVLHGALRWALGLLTAFALLVAVTATGTAIDSRMGADIVGAVFLWVTFGAFGWGTFRLWRRSRRSGE